MNRSIGTFESNTRTVPPGSTGGCGFVPMPKASETRAWETSRRPSEAASFASGVAVRSGRKMPYSTARPNSSRKTAVNASAGPVDRNSLLTCPNSGGDANGAVPVRSAQ